MWVSMRVSMRVSKSPSSYWLEIGKRRIARENYGSALRTTLTAAAVQTCSCLVGGHFVFVNTYDNDACAESSNGLNRIAVVSDGSRLKIARTSEERSVSALACLEC